MKITIICAGKLKERYLRDGIAEYEKRLRPYADVRTIEISEERMKDKPSAAEKAETMRREGARLLRRFRAMHISLCWMLEAQHIPRRSFRKRSIILVLRDRAILSFSSVVLSASRSSCSGRPIFACPSPASHFRINAFVSFLWNKFIDPLRLAKENHIIYKFSCKECGE